MASCPMGVDPKKSVVDLNGNLRGMENVLIADASILPTNLGQSPQGTIMAFAYEIAKYGDNGMAYSNEELSRYKKFYAKKMGTEYFFDLFSNTCRDYFIYFFKNYQSSKYYNKLKKAYYFFLK